MLVLCSRKNSGSQSRVRSRTNGSGTNKNMSAMGYDDDYGCSKMEDCRSAKRDRPGIAPVSITRERRDPCGDPPKANERKEKKGKKKKCVQTALSLSCTVNIVRSACLVSLVSRIRRHLEVQTS